MEKLLIQEYQNTDISIERLGKKFKIGKLKVKQILENNNIEIKKKGGQQKYLQTVPLKINIENKNLKCKKCGKIFNDIENKSGTIIIHIKKCFPEVEIPSKFKRSMFKSANGTFWHFQYFDIIDSIIKDELKCPECNWSTTDTKNKTGALTKHLTNDHKINISDFIKKHQKYEYLFNKLISQEQTKRYFNDKKENSVICQLCGETFKVISNTHLKLHNISSDKYRLLYGKDSIVSISSKQKFIDNIKSHNPSINFRSKGQIEIEEFLTLHGIEIDVCTQKVLNGTELDIYLPQHNIAIEYNGLYWHSEKNGKNKHYHLDKTKKCLEHGIRLIHIFSDEWLTKKEIIKNRLLNLLNKNSDKIYARKCQIINLTKEEKKDFLNKHHLQGNDKSTIMIGLQYENKNVAVMTFGKLRSSLGNKKKENNTFELYRFSSLNVVGGFSKLLQYFINIYSPEKIITYADRNWSPSPEHCFYTTIKGFKFISETKPNYYYTRRYEKKEHRFNYRKDILIKLGYDANKTELQIMSENGFDRIWDTGNLKYEIILIK